MLHKGYDRKVSGREPQGASRQDELIGGKPPVVNSDPEFEIQPTFRRNMSSSIFRVEELARQETSVKQIAWLTLRP
jgi:hypothetical protein